MRADGSRGTRDLLGVVAVGTGIAGIATGIVLSSAARAESTAPPGESEADAAARNSRISTLNTFSGVSYVAGGVFATVGVTLFLWPSSPATKATVSAMPGGAAAIWSTSF
jgi:hypothetical protein